MKVFKKILKNELAVMVAVLVLFFVVTVGLTLLYDCIPIMIHKSIYGEDSFWEGFLVNLHNSVFDFLILGVILYYFTNRISQKRKIEEYFENIDDVRFWFKEEATSKLVANITRLNQNGYTKMNLSKCYLKDAFLNNVKLVNSQLMGAVLEGASLRNATLNNSDFNGAKLQNAVLRGASLKEAKLRNIFCDGTNFTGSFLNDVDLRQARLINSDFRNAIFKGADLQGAEFENSSFVKANFIGARNIDINKIVKAKTLVSAKFDSQVRTEIERIRPDLFIP
ncbi:pentapeptide repeat-containing protein [Paenibacillus whitsoniae]|uniref:Pentapeptide repeat-containing protein n=1 Tax=Paenibacillus whitsoniae TaxID=2496558 RepID=A0A430J911_9BACL|nr:pentapeptide repeat-containing protein [Paenibacillus whitsoniae]RTE06770.1 pentapeptide repeat-containing protein [Paenibacillus whitsoniae]